MDEMDWRLTFKCTKCGWEEVQDWHSIDEGYIGWCEKCNTKCKMEWKMVVIKKEKRERLKVPKIINKEEKPWQLL